MKTLRDVVGALDELDEEAVIYTDGTSPAARALVLHEGEAADAKAAGLSYFLEVALARDAVDGGAPGAGAPSRPPTTS